MTSTQDGEPSIADRKVDTNTAGKIDESSDYFWACDNCEGGGGGALLLDLNPQCPMCDHLRCSNCPLEHHSLKLFYDYTAVLSDPSRYVNV